MKRILIIRLSAIGDVIFASGILPALRARYPDAHIAWLVEPMAAGLLAENDMLDEVIVWPKNDWKQLWRRRRFADLWRALCAFRRRLREAHFDSVIDLHGILKSGFLAWLSGSPRRIGLGRREGSWLFHTESVERDNTHPKISSEYRGMARHLGLPEDAFRMHIGVNETTAASARSLLGKVESSHYCVICPFTTRPQKHWVDAYWQAFIEHATSAEVAMPVVVLGGPGDHEHAQGLLAPFIDGPMREGKAPVFNMVGSTSLLEAAAIIEGAAVLVGVDTGLTHLGIAKARPTVAIFGSTCPYSDTGQTNARVIYSALPCSPCRRRPTCGGSFDCMKEITPQQVWRVAEQVMS